MVNTRSLSLERLSLWTVEMALEDGDEVDPGDVEEVAGSRLSSLNKGAWSSALSVSDFASCKEIGMSPVGFVQGCAVMQWAWYISNPYMGAANVLGGGGYAPNATRSGQYSETWRCPHGFVSADHRAYGYNFEQVWVEENWAKGFGLAYDRMMEEATTLGAHGVIGVVDEMRNLAGTGAVEFKINGTAVVVPGAKTPGRPFATFLSGQRLSKLLEAGFAPVSIVAHMSSVQMYGYCVTSYQMSGSGMGNWSGTVGGIGSIDQVGKAQRAARHLVRERIRAQLAGDTLHGAHLEISEHEMGEGAMSIACLMKGTRVRQFNDFAKLPDAEIVLRLA